MDYYAVLSRAVEQLERDAYAARGAIYDREHKALLKRLISSGAPVSDADIAREEQAFRDAVRRIEFPDDENQTPRAARREPAETAWSAVRDRARARRELTPEPVIDPERPNARQRSQPAWDADDGEPEESARKPIGAEMDFQSGGEDEEPGWDVEVRKPRRRSFLKVIIAYVLMVAVVFGAAVLGYAYFMGWINMGALRGHATAPMPVPTEQALLYEGGQAGQNGAPAQGKATWQTRAEPGKPDLVVTLDAEITEPPVALAMTLSHVTDASSGMSHLFELHFQNPPQSPLGGVARVSNISMRATADSASESLVGTSINIAPGQFMFGLLGVADVVQQNLQRLRKEDWLDLTLVFGNGASYTLSIEKGASGERVMSDALASWGQPNDKL